MKVLGLPLITNPDPQRGLRKALAGLGEYVELDWVGWNAGMKPGMTSFATHLLSVAESFRPDLIFAQLQTPDVIDRETARQLSALCLWCVSWNGDVRDRTAQWQFDLGYMGWVMLNSNMRDVATLQEVGIDSRYLQIGFDPEMYNPEGQKDDIGAVPPIVFLGNNYGKMHFPLSDQRRQMVQRLKQEFGRDFGVFGSNWGEDSHTVKADQEAFIYRSCTIAIGHNHYKLGRYFSDRQIRAMGCGAFMLAADYPDIKMEFEVGHHLGVWTDTAGIVTRVKWWLEHSGERTHVAAAGCRMVHHYHTWQHRMVELCEMLGIQP